MKMQRRVLALSTLLAIVFLVGLSFHSATVDALSCPPCTPERKARCPKLSCEYGETRSVCGCCNACGKGPGQECGGLWNMKGFCGAGYECDMPSSESFNAPPGKCVKQGGYDPE